MSRNLPLGVQGQVDFTTTLIDVTTGAAAPSGSSSAPMYVNFAQNTYQLASNQSLTTATPTTPVTGIIGASYVWNVAQATTFGGFSLVLESLDSAPGSTTYQTIATVTAPGSVGVVIGNNATVRLRAVGGTITALSSNLS